MSSKKHPASVSGTPQWLRMVNDRTAFRLLLSHGPLSRSQLGDLSGMSKPTASQMIQRLESAGLIEPAGEVSGSRGPSAVTYGVRMDSLTGVAINILEDHIESILVDPLDSNHPTAVLPTAADRSPATDVAAAVTAACAASGVSPTSVSHVVVGVQAAVHGAEDRLSFTDTLPGWPAIGARRQIEEATQLNVVIDNDANLATIAERDIDGFGEGDHPRLAEDFVYLWLGHGIGAGFDLGGTLLRGVRGSAGEIGYLEVPLAAQSIAPGMRDYTDLLGYQTLIDMLGARDYDEALSLLPGNDVVLDRYAQRVALLVRPLVAILDPTRIVLGGPTGGAGGTRLAELVQHHVADEVVISASSAGRMAVLTGARRLLVKHIRQQLEQQIKENV